MAKRPQSLQRVVAPLWALAQRFMFLFLLLAAGTVLLIGKADPQFFDRARIVVTDTIPDGKRLDPIRDKLKILTVARLLGDAVHRIHHDLSVSALFRQSGGSKR